MAQILSVCEKGKSKHFPPSAPLKTERRWEKFTRTSVDTLDKSRVCVLTREVKQNNVVQVFVAESQC